MPPAAEKTPKERESTKSATRPMDKIIEIPCDRLIPTKDNPRPKPDPEAIKQLGASIKSQGVLQPLLARPHPGRKPGHYDLRAGHRRLLAALSIGMETVPVIVRDMSDAEAVEVTVAENLQREDLDPLDEGKAIARLLQVGWSADDVAVKLGHTAGWVLRRAHLTRLHKRFVELHSIEKHPFAKVGVATLELIARLPDSVQASLGKQISKQDRWLPDWLDNASSCRSHIDRFVTMNLTRVPWKLEDAELCPKAGACGTCTLRSTYAPQLFDDVKTTGPGCCLNADCFNEKHRRSLKITISRHKKKHPELVLITTAPSGQAADEAKYFGCRVLNSYSVKNAKPGSRGAMPAVWIRGGKSGTLTHVKAEAAHGTNQTRPAGSTMSKAEKLEGLNARRKAWLIDRVSDILTERISELDDNVRPRWLTHGILADHLADLGVAFLMPVAYSMPGSGPDAWKRAEGYRKGTAGVKQLENDICAALYETLRSRLVRHDNKKLERYDDDVKRIAAYLEIDLKALRADAIKKIPEPAAWSKEVAPKVVKPKKSKAKSRRKA